VIVTRDLSGVLDAVLAGIVVLDEKGRVELVNSAACRLLEASAETAIGRPVESLLGSDHAIAKLARSVVQNRLEDVVAERERLAASGQIAAGIAHEVKNPLGGIRGAAEILGSRAADEKSRGTADLIVREATRIATLVDDLMVFASGDELRVANVNIHRVLDDVLDLLAMDPAASEIQVERTFDPSIPEVAADADRLTQVFLNLARNALQAMEKAGGTLTIETRMSLAQHLSSSGDTRTPAVQVTISDTGAGMAQDVLSQLGTPFFTTRACGTGLGLAVSNHWVLRHGGTLITESTPGKGTSVQVSLPLRGPS
jgi:two-component system nitrogen regulation sensor histidine kinase GlnL